MNAQVAPNYYPVTVGKTAYPLKSSAELKGPVPAFSKNESGDFFRLLDGPPYANGAPHLGHVLNKHLKDALARAALASGAHVEWRPGWDCHGLPLELAVEKQGVSRQDTSLFVQAAHDFALSQVQVQSHVFQEQGWMADWNSPWMTCQPDKEADTLRVFSTLLEKNLLDVRFTAVPWCSYCGSTLANAEQEEKSWTRESWLVPFKVENASKSSLVKNGDVLLSWTTTPWTLPLHRNLVLNPDATLVCLEKEGLRAWVTMETASKWAEKLEAQVHENLQVSAQDLEGLEYSSPWKTSTLAFNSKALSEAGTGLLHAVPGLSDLDTVLGREHQWDLVQYLSEDGKVQNSPLENQNGTYAGSPGSFADAHQAYENSPWFLKWGYTSEHPHCWRHQKPLLTRASRQVFLKLDGEVRERALEMVQKMEFTPETGRNRLLAFLNSRTDWCLSRQRTWGVPMALYLDKESGQPHSNSVQWMREVADVFEKEGVQSWWNGRAQPQNLSENVEVVQDVLDVWFDSACVPQFVGSADVVVEGSDQHRGWFQSCLWLAAALGEELPFKRVVTHGFVVTKSGAKLSKSKGGDGADKEKGLAPWSTFPSDVVRVWSLSGSEGADKTWTKDAVELSQAWTSRWRGVLRFMLANTLLQNYDVTDVNVWERYWMERCQSMKNSLLQDFVKGYTGKALQELAKFGEEFSSVCLGSWKDRLYCAPEFTPERQQLDVALKFCLHQWLTMLEVVTPRLRHEATPFLQESVFSLNADLVSLSEEELVQVKKVLQWRNELTEFMESTTHGKVPPMQRLASVPLLQNWTPLMVADALDVGEVEWAEQVQVVASSHACCPRCRRTQKNWGHSNVCQNCEERTK